MIPAQAVEAACEQLNEAGVYVSPKYMRAALEAAAPHMVADKRGEGDYLPSWDDRKTLAHLWQQHAMLPVDGLSERVYGALIAVATWGYQQRKDEAQ